MSLEFRRYLLKGVGGCARVSKVFDFAQAIQLQDSSILKYLPALPSDNEGRVSALPLPWNLKQSLHVGPVETLPVVLGLIAHQMFRQ